jgi:hypothetical protein
MKTKIMICLMSIILFSLGGCVWGDGATWEIEVVNNLSYPIYAIVTFVPNFSRPLGPILPGETAMRSINHINKDVSPEAHREIIKISVFSKDKAPFMILEGKEMDEHVIFVEKDKWDGYHFRLKVNEEHTGMGLNKKVAYKEIDECQIDQLNELNM